MKIVLAGWTPWFQPLASGRREYHHYDEGTYTYPWVACCQKLVVDMVREAAPGRYRCRSYARCPGSIARKLRRIREAQ